MKGFINIFQVLVTAVGGFFGWFIGGWDGLVYTLTAFVVIDYLTGLMLAVLDRKISSEVGFRGIFKKVMIFVFVGIGHIIDFHVLKNGSAIRTAVIFFYLSNEGISIIENSARIGLPVPDKLQAVFAKLKEEDE